MITVKIEETHEVPSGPYCVDYSVAKKLPPENACEFWEQTHTSVGWEDGLGSPGTLTFNHCRLFREGLSAEGPPPTKILKCQRCRAACD